MCLCYLVGVSLTDLSVYLDPFYSALFLDSFLFKIRCVEPNLIVEHKNEFVAEEFLNLFIGLAIWSIVTLNQLYV